MFDTRKVANQIKTARKNKNMTQMDLADAMGVSYQAVSNWERGNSMPDISKIPEICQVLEISFEELVGEKSKTTKTVKRMMEKEDTDITLEEVVDIAPLLEPKQVEEAVKDAVKESLDEGVEVNLGTILELAPFISEEAIDALCEQTAVEDPWLLVELAPFASEETLDRLVNRYQGSLGEALQGLAPFLAEETLDRCVDSYLQEKDCDLEQLIGMAPFLSGETADKIVAHLLKRGKADQVSAFAPFVSDGIINKLFGEKFSFFGLGRGRKDRRPIRNGGVKLHPETPEESEASCEDEEDVAELSWEDMDEDDIPALAEIALEKGLSVEPFLEYLDEDAMRELILKMARK